MIGNIFTQFMSKGSVNNRDSNQPLMNTSIATLQNRTSSTLYDSQKKKRFMKFFRVENGILTGIISNIAKDLVGDIYFEPVNNKGGRNRIKRAKDFYVNNMMGDMSYSQWVDALVTGESYTFTRGMDSNLLMKEIDKRLEMKGFPVNDFTRGIFYKANVTDEDALLQREIRYIASSTVQNIYDKFEILSYLQRVGSTPKEFNRENIIHYKLSDIDGRPGGFTPINALVTPLLLDSFMWNNMMALAKNGGQMDKIYSVEDVDINSPAFKRIEKELKRYHGMLNRHGSLLLNGKIKVEELQQLDQMQFKDLGFYVATVIALNYNYPKSRLPFVVGGSNVKEDTGGNADKGYYDNISYLQDRNDELMNAQFWIKHFGVRIKHSKAYKQDDVRETQTQMQRMDILTKMDEQYGKVKKRLTLDYRTRYINRISEEIEDEDLEDIPKEDLEQFQMLETGSNRNKLLSNDEVNDNAATKAVKAKKSKEQIDSANKRGTSNGFGKEKNNKSIMFDLNTLYESHLEGKEVKSVNFNMFVRLYNEDKSFNTEPPRVFMTKTDTETRMTYRSTDFVYETTAPNEEITPVKLMNFIKIYPVNMNKELEIMDDSEEDDDDDEEDMD